LVVLDINKMIELEKTYLAKEIPKELKDCKYKEIIDIYIPKDKNHPSLRIRKYGGRYVITKKEPSEDGDASKQLEQTIVLREDEFKEFMKLEGKKTHKIRYQYNYKDRIAEIDVFQGSLKGLIVVDFEFETEEEKNSFEIPDFCLADVTFELFIAGGMICGKSYEDIKQKLDKFNYKELYLD